MSVSAPRAARLVTVVSASPHGTMPEKCSSSGATLRLSPCSVTQRRTRTPILAILAPRTKMPIWPGLPLALDAEARKRRDQPVFERGDEGPHVAPARCEVEHHIGHALARAVIGEAPAAPALEHGEPVGRRAARSARRWCRRCRLADAPSSHTHSGASPRAMEATRRLHGGDGLRVGHETPAPQPFDPGLWRGGRVPSFPKALP